MEFIKSIDIVITKDFDELMMLICPVIFEDDVEIRKAAYEKFLQEGPSLTTKFGLSMKTAMWITNLVGISAYFEGTAEERQEHIKNLISDSVKNYINNHFTSDEEMIEAYFEPVMDFLKKTLRLVSEPDLNNEAQLTPND